MKALLKASCLVGILFAGVVGAETQYSQSGDVTSCYASGSPSCQISCRAPSVAYCIQGLDPTTDSNGNSSGGIPGNCMCQ